MPPYLRRKIDPSKLDSICERAAAIVSLEREMLQRFPLDAETVANEWSVAWSQGSEHVDTEIQVYCW